MLITHDCGFLSSGFLCGNRTYCMCRYPLVLSVGLRDKRDTNMQIIMLLAVLE